MIHFPSETILIWITQYGSFALFGLLALGIFALPVPDETLIVFAGILISKGKLSLVPTIIAVLAGTCSGITLSYLVGRTAGTYLIKKYGHWFGITPTKMTKVHQWFENIGRWALSVGYFIPGVRHLTGYAAGISELHYRQFALFAYSGAVIWSSLFLSAGYFLGNKWIRITELTEEWYVLGAVIVLVLGIGVYLYYTHLKKGGR